MIIEKIQKNWLQWKNFTRATVKKDFGSRKNLPLSFAKNIRTRITVPVKKPVNTMETVKNAWQSTERTRNMYRTV